MLRLRWKLVWAAALAVVLAAGFNAWAQVVTEPAPVQAATENTTPPAAETPGTTTPATTPANNTPANTTPANTAPANTTPATTETPAPTPPAEQPPAETPEQILQDKPSFLVHIDVDRPDRSYAKGESLRVNVTSEEDAYVYVQYKQADGKVFQIFPNAAQPENKVKGKTTVSIPATDDQFRWRIGAPYGKEFIKVIASKQPLAKLDSPALKAQRFNPVSKSQIKDTAIALKAAEPIQWAESVVEIETADRKEQASTTPAPRRFGVFFGVSKHLHHDLLAEISEGKWKPDLAAAQFDAIMVDKAFHAVGKFTDSRVFINEQATRAQMEQALTKWLPSVTRPGDVVVFLFSGHTGQIDDDNGDEKDGKDEWMLTHDFADSWALMGLVKRKKEGRLDAQGQKFLDYYLRIIQGAKDDNDIQARLNRATGVTDDLLGHWLQRLSGRQIIVLMDSCHSGGYSNIEKSFSSAGLPEGSDFLETEIERLKDIGQPESVLLSACSVSQEAAGMRFRDEVLSNWEASRGPVEEWTPENLGVLCYYLIESMFIGKRPLTIEQVHEHCQTEMQKYFERLNKLERESDRGETKPHQPQLFNYSTRPVVIKP